MLLFQKSNYHKCKCHGATVVFTTDVYHTTFDYPNSVDVERRLVEPPEGCGEAAMVDRLVLYHRYIPGLKTAFQRYTKAINADQPKADVYSQGIFSPQGSTLNFHAT